MSLHVNKLWPHVGKDLGLLLWWRSLENFVDMSMHLSWYRKRKFKLYLMSTKFFKPMEYMAWCTALWAFTSLKFEKRGDITIFWVIFSRSKAMTNRTQRPKIDTGGKITKIAPLFSQRSRCHLLRPDWFYEVVCSVLALFIWSISFFHFDRDDFFISVGHIIACTSRFTFDFATYRHRGSI